MTVSAVTNTCTDIVKNNKKLIGLGGLTTAAFCLFDFMEVPKSFKLEYNEKGEKVEGTNMKSGFKEILKSIPKCAASLILPAVIGGACMSAGPLVAAIGGVLAFASPMISYSILDKILPHESEVVAEACKKKGIELKA